MITAPVDPAPHGPCQMLYDAARRLQAWVDCNAYPLRVRSWPRRAARPGCADCPSCRLVQQRSGSVVGRAPSGAPPRDGRDRVWCPYPDLLRLVQAICGPHWPHWAGRTEMKGRNHTPEQIERRLREADRMAGEGAAGMDHPSSWS